METFKKKYKEVIALYKLENEINDVYVEGNSDKVFIENYLNMKKVKKNIITIESIDFSELDSKYWDNLDWSSKRDQVIILSKLICEKAPKSDVRFIIDKDFDEYIESITNEKLYKTDYSCMESYLYCDLLIDKLLKIGIGNFPYKSDFVLLQMEKVLKSLFCLRLCRALEFKSTQLIELDGNLQIDKKNGKISFDENDYLTKFINKNKLSKHKKIIFEKYDSTYKKLNRGIKNELNGHDYMKVLFLYVNKIKNTPNYRFENFNKTVFLSVENTMLDKYTLFKKLIA